MLQNRSTLSVNIKDLKSRNKKTKIRPHSASDEPVEREQFIQRPRTAATYGFDAGGNRVRSSKGSRPIVAPSNDIEGVFQNTESDSERPWAITQLPTNAVQELNESTGEDDVEEIAGPDEQVDLPLKKKPTPRTLEAWLTETGNSDDYDTDLEDDFAPEPELPTDPTGRQYYEDSCRKLGVVPVSYLCKHLGDRHIRMRHHYLGDSGSRPIAAAFKRNTIVEVLDFTDNYLSTSGARWLANMLKENMFITTLNISYNFIRSDGLAAIADMLDHNTTLKTLILKGNLLEDQDALKLSGSLKNNISLTCLDLSHNKFGEFGGIHLGLGMALNEGITDLDLSWNSITRKGAVAIINCLKTNLTLETLDLSWNGLAQAGGATLQKILKVNKFLKVLDISHNRIDTQSAVHISQGLVKNTGLETLLINFNPIKEQGMEALLKAVQKNSTLKLLGIEDIYLSPGLLDKVREIEESRDIIIMYTRTPGICPTRIQTSVLALFERFLSDNRHRLEALFTQLDKDKSGDITVEELKHGLRESGLRLTTKQVDCLLDEIDLDRNGTVEYHELLTGEPLIQRGNQRKLQYCNLYAQSFPAQHESGDKML